MAAEPLLTSSSSSVRPRVEAAPLLVGDESRTIDQAVAHRRRQRRDVRPSDAPPGDPHTSDEN